MRHTGQPLLFSLLVAAAALAGAACKKAGDAKLTIVGASQLAADPGETIELRVKYTDLRGSALPGTVDFSVSRSSLATLSASRVEVNDNGLATVSLAVKKDTDDEKEFQVQATASDAGTVEWRIRLDVKVLPGNVEGTYELRSDIRVPSGAPGGRDIQETLSEACDDRDDPGKFFIDLMAGEDPSAQLILSLWRPDIDNTVNDMFPDRGAGFKRDFCAAADMVKEMTENFRLISQLRVELATDDTLKGTHQVEGFGFRNDVYYFRDHGIGLPDEVEVALGLDQERGVLTLEQHTFPIYYGTILQAALEETILPEVGRGLEDLVDLLERDIDCRTIGQRLAQMVGSQYSTVLQLACSAGLRQIATSLEAEFDAFNAASMTLSGEGNLRKSTSAEVNEIYDGRWRGSMQYEDSEATLHKSDSLFQGERSF